LSLLAPAGVHKWEGPRETNPRGELVGNEETVDVGFRLNFCTQLCPGEILRGTAEMDMGIDMTDTDRRCPVARLQVAATFCTI